MSNLGIGINSSGTDGLTNGQFSLLMSLNRPQFPAMALVAKLLAMDRTTLTAALKPLERKGLVAIGVDPADRRSRLLMLTDDGARRSRRRCRSGARRTHNRFRSGSRQIAPGEAEANDPSLDVQGI